jgi:hypothetical protein
MGASAGAGGAACAGRRGACVVAAGGFTRVDDAGVARLRGFTGLVLPFVCDATLPPAETKPNPTRVMPPYERSPKPDL